MTCLLTLYDLINEPGDGRRASLLLSGSCYDQSQQQTTKESLLDSGSSGCMEEGSRARLQTHICTREGELHPGGCSCMIGEMEGTPTVITPAVKGTLRNDYAAFEMAH